MNWGYFMSTKPFVVGFANLDEASAYSQAVRRGLQEALARHPAIELIVRDNALDDERALENAKAFSEAQVDVAIVYHINERLGPQLKAALWRCPIIAVDIPIHLSTYFGIDNAEMGDMAGTILSTWIKRHWQAEVDRVVGFVDSRVLGTVRTRTLNALAIMTRDIMGAKEGKIVVDCGNTRETAYQMTHKLLQSWSEHKRIAVVGFNEESTLGAADAVADLARDQHVVIVGHAASHLSVRAMQAVDTRIIAATATSPEKYGEYLTQLILRIQNKERLKPHHHIPLQLITAPTNSIQQVDSA